MSDEDEKKSKIYMMSVNELWGMKFFIPDYQRGYRWETHQVEDLLNDISEFEPETVKDEFGNIVKNEDKNDRKTFYCLQPLVVQEMTEKNKKDHELETTETWHEVIDGQQRLTTIFLILKYLEGKEENPYELYYATRSESAGFLKQINSANEEVKSNLETKKDDNIDFFHIWEAYNETITNWFDENDKKNDGFKKTFKEKLQNNVKFIRYKTDEVDPIEVFTRLNIGKISLTNSELIKALFLNSSNFKSDTDIGNEKDDMTEQNTVRLRQQEIAGEWDNIEYTLQNDEFWLFLNKTRYDKPTRIDFIFDLVCQLELQKDSDKLKNYIGNKDEYKTFRYFYEQFKLATTKEDWLKEWRAIKEIFQIFCEWYDDLKFYHYVGYLINQNMEIKKLISKWQGDNDKASFLSFLKDSIKSIIDGCPKLDFQYKEDGSDKGKCKPILLFHNIQTVINQNIRQENNEKYKVGVFYKFPFHLYKIEGWDVEHINSNTENPEDDDKTRKEWLVNVYLGVNDDIQKKILEYFDIEDKEKKDEFFKEIKNIFSNQEVWTSKDKNMIWNYVLLDSSTNRKYGNSIFSGKRRVIIDKDKGESTEIPKIGREGRFVFSKVPAISSFVPPCTKQVFLKYYSPAIGDNNYWQKTDANNYLEDIEECIKQLSEVSNEEKINE